MQVWNLLHVARWKHRTQKSRQKSPSGQHRKTLSGHIFATKARIDNQKKKLVKHQHVLHISPQYGELRPTNGWDRFTSLAALLHGSQVVSVSQTVAWNRGRHLCLVQVKIQWTRIWANAKHDGHPAEYRWRPLFNATKFGWRPLLECSAVTLSRRETGWN